MPIKNIIFDLGGVILNIDYRRTTSAFRKLGIDNFDHFYNQHNQEDLFDQFDLGKISAKLFRNTVRNKFNITMTDQEFDQAWNAMLLSIPKARLDYIKNLREKYKIFLFSNTNEIHLNHIMNICKEKFGFKTFQDFFDKEYYSCQFGQRKPDPDAFICILNENELLANETLFIDDSLQHVLGARKAGIKAIHLTKEKSIFDIIV